MGKAVKSHIPCPMPGCNSSDAATVFEDRQGKQYTICFSASCPSNGKAIYGDVYSEDSEEVGDEDNSNPVMVDSYNRSAAVALRGLSLQATGFYGIKKTSNGNILFPYFKDSELVSLKVRKSETIKEFTVQGDNPASLLFGIQAFKPGGKAVTITEGEFDAVAVYQAFGCKYPAVSIPTGAKGALKACKANFEWLNSFDSIYLSFDMDDDGQKSAVQIAELFPGKAKIVKMRHKDANEYIKAGEEAQFVKDWWSAQDYVPDGIVVGNTLWDRVNQPMATPKVPFPFTALNDMLYGIYPRRLYTITAGSGVGKSQFVRELAYHILTHTKANIGLLMLEEAVEETAVGFMSLHLNKPLHVPGTKYTEEEYEKAYIETHGDGRLYYHDHFGSTSVSNILDRVRYLVKAADCEYIILDHLSIIVSAQQQDDERKAIDEVMTKLRMLVQETGVTIFLIAHLRRVPGKVYTEGAQTSASDMRGSASIEQLSDFIIGLERNGQADDDKESNTTTVRVLKSRRFGRLGVADRLHYNRNTGRMKEVFYDDAL